MGAVKRLMVYERAARFPLVLDRGAATGVDDLELTVRAAMDAMGEGFVDISDFSGFRSDAVSPEHLAALLRTLSAAEGLSVAWSRGLAACRRRCLAAGLDQGDVLFGMDGVPDEILLSRLSQIDNDRGGAEAAVVSWLSVEYDRIDPRGGDFCAWVGQRMGPMVTGSMSEPPWTGGGATDPSGGLLAWCAKAAIEGSSSKAGWWQERGVRWPHSETMAKSLMRVLWRGSEFDGSRGNPLGAALLTMCGLRDSVSGGDEVMGMLRELGPRVVGMGLGLFGRDMSSAPADGRVDFASSGSSARKRVKQAAAVLEMMPGAAQFADMSWSGARWPAQAGELRAILERAGLAFSGGAVNDRRGRASPSC